MLQGNGGKKKFGFAEVFKSCLEKPAGRGWMFLDSHCRVVTARRQLETVVGKAAKCLLENITAWEGKELGRVSSFAGSKWLAEENRG